MATVEKSGSIKFKDSSGNTTVFYPNTLKSNVSGMGEVDTHISASKPIDMASTDGVTYTCTVPGISVLTAGVNFVGVPKIVSTSQAVKLNVNGLGDKLLRRRVSSGSATTASGYANDWLASDKPLRLMYDGTFWVADITQPYAGDLMGIVPIEKGGTGNATGRVTAGQKADSTLGKCATTEGFETEASGEYSHAEGYRVKATGAFAHAEGYQTEATDAGAHAEGFTNTAQGAYSHAEGYCVIAYGDYSHAEGYATIANGNYAHVSGRYNMQYAGPSSVTSTDGPIFIVGNGTSNTARTNAFRITTAGACMGTQSFTASGADYAEYFEWVDGNADDEDRRGRFVTLDGEKIRIANDSDDYILGVVSARPSVIGDGFTDQWKSMYLTDVFGEELTETVEVPESTDEVTGKTIPAHTETRFVINPEYDNTQNYVGRELRKEWAAVGLVGKLVIVDDGTCEANGYCKVAASGGATKSTEKTPYRVMSRLDDTHIRVFIK